MYINKRIYLLSIAISLQVASSPAVRQCNVADDQNTYKINEMNRAQKHVYIN